MLLPISGQIRSPLAYTAAGTWSAMDHRDDLGVLRGFFDFFWHAPGC